MKNLRMKLERIAAVRTARARASSPPASEGELCRLLPGRIARTATGEHFVCFHEVADGLPTISGAALEILTGITGAASIPQSEWLFLDTETTGLAGGTGTYAFLVGLAQPNGDGLRIDQHFMRNPVDERSLLDAVSERLARARLLITFNGKAFDLPLLETRFRLARMEPPTAHLAHFDLLYPARQLWRRRLGTVRLAELERQLLGREREGDIPGEQIPQVYFDYLRNADSQPLVAVFRHNRCDLESLGTLLASMAELVRTESPALEDPTDWFGLSRLLENRGLLHRSRQFYERALEEGLPTELESKALGRLAALWKRAREYSRATPLWRRWSDCDQTALEPELELAIFHEHRSRNYVAALEAVHRAMAKLEQAAAAGAIERDSLLRQRRELQHRSCRLERKHARTAGINLELKI